MTPSRCRGFKILPYESFYPIHYLFWRGYFSERDSNDHPNWGSKTIGAHVWNSFSAKLPVRKSSNQYYTQMARTSCPKTFELAPPEFWYCILYVYVELFCLHIYYKCEIYTWLIKVFLSVWKSTGFIIFFISTALQYIKGGHALALCAPFSSVCFQERK